VTFADWLPVSCGAQYALASYLYWRQGEPWPAWMYFGYAFANVGAVMIAIKARGI
jgi:hypothetical protein